MNISKDKIRVIIIDTSAVSRYLLTEILEQSGGIKTVAAVSNFEEAISKIELLGADVIILDAAAPRMSGFAFLKKLTSLYPTPVIMVNAAAQNHSESAHQAINLGAVAYVGRKSTQPWSGILDIADEIVDKVRLASTAQSI